MTMAQRRFDAAMDILHGDVPEDQLVPGDSVIWRRDGEVWTVNHIDDDPSHPRPVSIMQRMFGDGPMQHGHAHPSELVRISR